MHVFSRSIHKSSRLNTGLWGGGGGGGPKKGGHVHSCILHSLTNDMHPLNR